MAEGGLVTGSAYVDRRPPYAASAGRGASAKISIRILAMMACALFYQWFLELDVWRQLRF